MGRFWTLTRFWARFRGGLPLLSRRVRRSPRPRPRSLPSGSLSSLHHDLSKVHFPHQTGKRQKRPLYPTPLASARPGRLPPALPEGCARVLRRFPPCLMTPPPIASECGRPLPGPGTLPAHGRTPLRPHRPAPGAQPATGSIRRNTLVPPSSSVLGAGSPLTLLSAGRGGSPPEVFSSRNSFPGPCRRGRLASGRLRAGGRRKRPRAVGSVPVTPPGAPGLTRVRFSLGIRRSIRCCLT